MALLRAMAWKVQKSIKVHQSASVKVKEDRRISGAQDAKAALSRRRRGFGLGAEKRV
jgi:hypothetical protein